MKRLLFLLTLLLLVNSEETSKLIVYIDVDELSLDQDYTVLVSSLRAAVRSICHVASTTNGLNVSAALISKDNLGYNLKKRIMAALSPSDCKYGIPLLQRRFGSLGELVNAVGKDSSSSDHDNNILFQSAYVVLKDTTIEHLSSLNKDTLYGCFVANDDGEKTIYTAGVDVALHKSPLEPWTFPKPDNADKFMKNIPYPVSNYRGFPVWYKDLNRVVSSPYAVGKECFALSSSLIKKFPFHADYPPDIVVFDVAVSLRKASADKDHPLYSIKVDPQLSGVFVGGREGASDKRAQTDFIFAKIEDFERKNIDFLMKEIMSRRKLSNMTVIWNMYCGSGAVLGFTTEAINAIESIKDSVSVMVEAGNVDRCVRDLREYDYPEAVLQDLLRLSRLEVEYEGNVLLIVHNDPGSYTKLMPQRYGKPKPKWVVLRSMYETDSISQKWVTATNGKELAGVWVPSAFNVESFAKGGTDRNALSILHEAMDTDLFTPNAMSSAVCDKTIPMPDGRIKGEKEFAFVAMGKYEPRKGFEHLVKAYLTAFSDADDVSLTILSHPNDKEMSKFESKVNSIINGLSKDKKSHLPRLPVLLNAILPNTELPCILSKFDTFVSSSHGEGWGLPQVQAMSMGIPLVFINFGGTTEYANKDNAYPVEVKEKERASNGKWAKIDESLLGTVIRSVFDDREKAKSISSLARTTIKDKFSPEAFANEFVALCNTVAKSKKIYVPPKEPTNLAHQAGPTTLNFMNNDDPNQWKAVSTSWQGSGPINKIRIVA